MKNTVQTLLVLLLASIVLFQSIVHQKAIDEAKTLTHQFAAHLDTLQLISMQYETNHQRYVALHKKLLHTQKRATHLSSALSVISNNQRAELEQIQEELQKLVAYDRKHLIQSDPAIDSLVFLP